MCTLHAFAQRLLTEHPLDAGLPPRVEVADEVTSQLAFDERWAALVDELLDDDRLRAEPGDEEALAILLDEPTGLRALRAVALAFEGSWDLVAEHVAGQPLESLLRLDVTQLVMELFELAGTRVHATPEDRLALVLADLEDEGRALAEASTPSAQLRVLARVAAVKVGNRGTKPNWKGSAWENDLGPLRDRVAAVAEQCRAARQVAVDGCLWRIAVRLGNATVAAARERRAEGRLAFHDLLVLARELLRDPVRGPEARATLHTRYTRLLLDEFQDTDPIQLEIATLLTAPPSAVAADWRELVPEPGRLFLVGDPKQSIYRFRRADIATFLAARDTLTERPVALTANFRTAAPVVAWVNALFEQLIHYTPGAQPAFQRLEAVRSEALGGPAVLLMGEEHPDRPSAPELRQREVADAVSAIQEAVALLGGLRHAHEAGSPGHLRRRRHPHPQPHRARRLGGRPRRGHRALPHGEQLAGLRQPRGALPPPRSAGRRRSERRAGPLEHAAVTAVRLQRSRAVPVGERSRRAVERAARRAATRRR